jgi:hypothetical protein
MPVLCKYGNKVILNGECISTKVKKLMIRFLSLLNVSLLRLKITGEGFKTSFLKPNLSRNKMQMTTKPY